MFRLVLGLGAAALVAVSTVSSASAEGKTIRIEPRPFYGATVSIESGVRVFRPVPPTTRMIINPNKTPLRLSIEEETKTVNKTVRHYGSNGGNAHAGSNDGYVGTVGPYGYTGGKHGHRGGKKGRIGKFH